MHNVALIFFAHLYGLGTTAPAMPQQFERPRVADHGFSIATPEWHRFTLTHTMTTFWVNDAHGTPMVGSAQYDVELRWRFNPATLTISHESWHNADVIGPDREWNRIGLEVKL
jgi:hypothetical protein